MVHRDKIHEYFDLRIILLIINWEQNQSISKEIALCVRQEKFNIESKPSFNKTSYFATPGC